MHTKKKCGVYCDPGLKCVYTADSFKHTNGKTNVRHKNGFKMDWLISLPLDIFMLATDQETKTLRNKAGEGEEECGESQGSLLGSNLAWGPRQPWEWCAHTWWGSPLGSGALRRQHRLRGTGCLRCIVPCHSQTLGSQDSPLQGSGRGQPVS